MSNYKTTEALSAIYDQWQKEQNLKLGSADEHMFDETLTSNQRRWLYSFSKLWEITQRMEDETLYVAEKLEQAIKTYFEAQNKYERDAAYEHVLEWYAADPDLPDDADIVAGVETMLRNRGCKYS